MTLVDILGEIFRSFIKNASGINSCKGSLFLINRNSNMAFVSFGLVSSNGTKDTQIVANNGPNSFVVVLKVKFFLISY